MGFGGRGLVSPNPGSPTPGLLVRLACPAVARPSRWRVPGCATAIDALAELCPPCQTLRDVLLETERPWLVEHAAGDTGRQVFLWNVRLRDGMRILVSVSVAQLFHQWG